MADERTQFDIDELHEVFTEKSIIDEASRSTTLRNGKYNITVMKANGYYADEKSPTPGRRMIDFQVKVDIPDSDKSTTKFIRTSFETFRVLVLAGERKVIPPSHDMYSKDLPLDSASKRWAQMVKVIDKEGVLAIPDQVRALMDSTMGSYVIEGFRTADGDMHFYKTDEERKALVDAGYEPTNFFTSFFPVKD